MWLHKIKERKRGKEREEAKNQHLVFVDQEDQGPVQYKVLYEK